MASRIDSQLVEEMLKLPESLMAEYFARNAHLILDDANYWNLLGTLWKLGGTVLQQDMWMVLFTSKRRRRHKIMKSRERRAWRRLPKTVIGFRAVNYLAEADTAISWTLSKRIAEKVFSEKGTRLIVKKVFDKSQVFAFFDRRKESEILVFQKNQGTQQDQVEAL